MSARPTNRDIIEAIPEETLHEALENLPWRQRRVLEMRYGLDGEQPRTLKEIGRTFNLTAGGVGRIEKETLKVLTQ
jgi:RNA polymerase primary sigma factor